MGNDVFRRPDARRVDDAAGNHLSGNGRRAGRIDVARAGVPLRVGACMTIEGDGLLATSHDYARNLVIIGRRAPVGQRVEILDAPAGPHAPHDLSDEGPIESDLEVRVSQSLLLEPKR